MKERKLKLRAATKHFMDKSDGHVVLKPSHCVEVLYNRRWQLLGDDKGILRFDSKEARDAFIAEHQGKSLMEETST